MMPAVQQHPLPTPQTQTIWVLIANSSDAYTYTTKRLGKAMQLLEHESHPQSREKRQAINSDRSGLGSRPISGYGALPLSSDPKEVEAERFARAISEHLEQYAFRNKFNKLVLVAPPHFMGLVMKHKKANWRNKVSLKIEKDYVQTAQHHLPKYLEKHLP